MEKGKFLNREETHALYAKKLISSASHMFVFDNMSDKQITDSVLNVSARIKTTLTILSNKKIHITNVEHVVQWFSVMTRGGINETFRYDENLELETIRTLLISAKKNGSFLFLEISGKLMLGVFKIADQLDTSFYCFSDETNSKIVMYQPAQYFK